MRIVVLLAVAAAVFAAVWIVVEVVAVSFPLPYWDQWDFVYGLPDYFAGGTSLANLWSQHNEHRIFFPRLLFLADVEWFHGRSFSLVVVSLLAQALHAAVLVSLMRGIGKGSRAELAVAGAVIVVCMSHASQLLNLFWGFQVQFVLVYLATTAALWALARHKEAATRWAAVLWLVTALLAGTLATGSMANGILVWPLLVSIAWQLRVRALALATVAVAGAALVTAYLWGYSTPEPQMSPLAALAHPFAVLGYACAFLGSPLREWGLVPSVLGGGLLCAVGLAILARAVPRWRDMAPRRAALLHVIAFVFGSALLAGLGRSHLALTTAITSRYSTPVLVACAALAALSVSVPVRPASGRLRAAALCAAGVIVALSSPVYHLEGFLVRRSQVDAATSVLAGAPDLEALKLSHDVNPDWVLAGVKVLNQYRLSVYSDGRHLEIGQLLHANHATVDFKNGAFDRIDPLPGGRGGWRFEGWTFDPRNGKRASYLLAVDLDGRIVGLGHPGIARHDVLRALPQVRDVGVGWKAWGRDLSSIGEIPYIYAVLDDSLALRIPHESNPKPVFVSDSSPLGAPVRLASVAMVGRWSRGGAAEGLPVPEFAGETWGSWCGDDSNIGTLTLALAAPAEKGTLIVPVLTGPDASAVFLRIEDSLTRRAVARVFGPERSGDRWSGWKVELPARGDGGHWLVIAEDRGTKWGQWFAVGTPRWIPAH
jgi:hypothetical protein